VIGKIVSGVDPVRKPIEIVPPLLGVPTDGMLPKMLRMSRSSWKFATAVPV
jgi:hypothetical protein